MKPGDLVECKCSPNCERSWPEGHGPCVRGKLLSFEKEDGERLARVKMSRGAFSCLVPIGYGQYVRDRYAEEVLALASSLRVSSPNKSDSKGGAR